MDTVRRRIEGEHVELIRGCFFNPATDYGPDFEKNLALIAPEDIREMAQDHYSMSPKWVSLALFSDLEKQLPKILVSLSLQGDGGLPRGLWNHG